MFVNFITKRNISALFNFNFIVFLQEFFFFTEMTKSQSNIDTKLITNKYTYSIHSYYEQPTLLLKSFPNPLFYTPTHTIPSYPYSPSIFKFLSPVRFPGTPPPQKQNISGTNCTCQLFEFLELSKSNSNHTSCNQKTPKIHAP